MMPVHSTRSGSCSTLGLSAYGSDLTLQKCSLAPNFTWIFADVPFNHPNSSLKTAPWLLSIACRLPGGLDCKWFSCCQFSWILVNQSCLIRLRPEPATTRSFNFFFWNRYSTATVMDSSIFNSSLVYMCRCTEDGCNWRASSIPHNFWNVGSLMIKAEVPVSSSICASFWSIFNDTIVGFKCNPGVLNNVYTTSSSLPGSTMQCVSLGSSFPLGDRLFKGHFGSVWLHPP